ncbi:GNAT family N-acetyltransferase [Kitasatospora aureofaciens]|uniref:GNAT family N-acetyltransferase n=1 Tax=Kitasatospora aureofaciens TaxID=1894 RepID=UPI003F4D1376
MERPHPRHRGEPPTVIEILRFDQGNLPEGLRQLLLDVHDEAYHDRRHEEFVQRFPWFVDHWSSKPGFTCVVAYDGDAPIGFSYGAPLTEGKEWWRDHMPAPERFETFGVSELMLRPAWRKQGISPRLHQALLTDRTEALAVLTVDTVRPRLQALYESWGYRKVGEHQSFIDSPLYAVMVCDLPAAG